MLAPHQHGVLVGVDGTLASDAACRYGCAQAAQRHLPITVLHAWLPHSIYLGATTTSAPIWGSEAAVEAAARQVLTRATELVMGWAPALPHQEHPCAGSGS
jgi:hypothetical protein